MSSEEEKIQEIWRPIQGFVDYFASNLGRIKSLKNWRGTSERIITQCERQCGNYIRKTVYINYQTKKVHQLVYEAFHGPISQFTFYKCIDHIDRDCQFNHASNLRWVTQQLNCLNRKVKGFEKIRKKNGAIFYRSRVIVEGDAISQFCRTRDEAIRETHRVQCESFDRIYKRHVDDHARISTAGEVNLRAPHHFLWTDRTLETPEGFELGHSGDGRHSENRCPKFTVYNLS